MPVTQKDIARELNISDSLVGKVLKGNPNGRTSPELRDKIHRTAHDMGYRPNAAARALVSGRTDLVSVWSAFLDLPLYTRYIARLQRLANSAGSQVLIRDASHDPGGWNWPADGIICIDAPSRVREHREMTGGAAIPIISLGVLDCEGVDQVLLDFEPGTLEALRELARRGRRRIAYLLPGHALRHVTDGRWTAYHRVIGELGNEPELIVSEDMSHASAHAALAAHAARHGLPDALLIFGSFMAMGVTRALDELGAARPRDIALITVGDSPELPFYSPSFSTVEGPIEMAAGEAWRLLRLRLENPEAPLQRLVLPTRFVERDSSR